MNTTENNKIIAEFMDLPTIVFNSGILNYGLNEAWYELEELSYDTSWDWLMGVVKKIKVEAFQNLGLEEYRKHKTIWRMVENPADYEIEKVFEQVVEFIKRKN